jgi:hypothetical protein
VVQSITHLEKNPAVLTAGTMNLVKIFSSNQKELAL